MDDESLIWRVRPADPQEITALIDLLDDIRDKLKFQTDCEIEIRLHPQRQAAVLAIKTVSGEVLLEKTWPAILEIIPEKPESEG
jgi:hypothetical protein